MSDRNFFIGMPEEELVQRKEISRDILQDMQYELKLPAKEILDYTKTRTQFENKIRDWFHISKKSAQEIRKMIENELGQGRG